jgi:hypothetical protein
MGIVKLARRMDTRAVTDLRALTPARDPDGPTAVFEKMMERGSTVPADSISLKTVGVRVCRS